MTDPMFVLDRLADPLPAPGDTVLLDGDEGRHAAAVRRLRVGESVLVSDGRGLGVRGVVVEAMKTSLTLQVTEQLQSPDVGQRFVAVQALAKGDRAELACEMLTEMGVYEIIPWQSSRSIVRWEPDRAAKSLARWRSTVREAAKQSRRLRIPTVSQPVSTAGLLERIQAGAASLVLHEDATTPLSAVELPGAGEVLIIIGPEGGISADELASCAAAGARQVVVSDGVLRTSTAGVVALAGLMLRPPS